MSDLGNRLMMEAIRKNLPEINQRRQRHTRTSSIEEQFRDLQSQPGNGNYNPASRGSWYDVVRERIPDYKQMGNQAVGALGQFYAGREADKQKVDLDNMVGTESVNALQQIGGGDQDGEATAQALRGYLGMMGGPVGKDVIAKAPHVAATKVDKDGKIFTVMSDGSSVDTGRVADYNTRVMEDGAGGLISVGTAGAGRGVGAPVVTAGSGAPAPTENIPDRYVSPDGEEVVFGPDVNQNTRRTILGLPTVEGPEPVRVMSAAEKAAAQTAAKAQAENQNVDLIADTAERTRLAQEQAKNTAEAQANLGKVRQVGDSLLTAIRDVRNAPGLKNVVGGSIASRLPDRVASPAIDLFAAGTDTADAMAKHKRLTGSTFLKGFEQLKGGGQITEKEGEKAEAAFGRLQRSQSMREYLAALDELEQATSEMIQNAERRASGGRPAPAPAPQGNQFQLPAGWSVKVKGE